MKFGKRDVFFFEKKTLFITTNHEVSKGCFVQTQCSLKEIDDQRDVFSPKVCGLK